MNPSPYWAAIISPATSENVDAHPPAHEDAERYPEHHRERERRERPIGAVPDVEVVVGGEHPQGRWTCRLLLACRRPVQVALDQPCEFLEVVEVFTEHS